MPCGGAGLCWVPLLASFASLAWCAVAVVAVVLGASLFCLSLPLAGCCCIPLLLWVLALASFRSLYRYVYRYVYRSLYRSLYRYVFVPFSLSFRLFPPLSRLSYLLV